MDVLNKDFVEKETEHNLFELYEFIAAGGKGSIYRNSCVNWVITKPSTWPNIIYNAHLSEKDSSCMSSVFSAIRQKKAPPFWITGPSSHNIESILEDNGMILIDELPGMALDLEVYTGKKNPGSLPEGVEIRHVSTKEELMEWMKIVSTCIFRGKKLDMEMMINLLPHSSIRLYLAYWNGEPAATFMSYRSGKTAGLYNAGTMPAFRRKGLAKLSMDFVLKDSYRSVANSPYYILRKWQNHSGGIWGFKNFCEFHVYWMSGKEFRDF